MNTFFTSASNLIDGILKTSLFCIFCGSPESLCSLTSRHSP
jgi:hypothetical protein